MLRFLVVDDDHSAVHGMTRLLIEDGHIVSPFLTGAAALEALSLESFDAVVTDLEMPGVDGRAVARAARQTQPGACLAIVTARGEGAADTLLMADACIVADKPLDYDGLLAAIANCRRDGPSAHGLHHVRLRNL